jgi:hypothetical protein
VTGIKDEEIRLGRQQLFVLHPDGMANARLRIPSEKQGIARNMNTIAKLVHMAAAGAASLTRTRLHRMQVAL